MVSSALQVQEAEVDVPPQALEILSFVDGALNFLDQRRQVFGDGVGRLLGQRWLFFMRS